MAEFKVDQSGKWEESKPTAIGVGGPLHYALLVELSTKHRANSLLKRMNQERNRAKGAFQVRMFAYTVFLALKDVYREGDAILIDEEYSNQDRRIRDILVSLFKSQRGIRVEKPLISFGKVDRTTLAHLLANQTFKRERKPDRVATIEEYYCLLDRTPEIRLKSFRKRMRRNRVTSGRG